MFKQLALSAVVLWAWSLPAAAQTPAPLQPWEAWAAAPFAYRDCAIKPDAAGAAREDYACQWPGQLRLVLGSEGGRFSQSWQVEQKGRVALPGSRDAWPQGVRVDGVPAPVVEENGLPVVQLGPGQYTVEGQWTWEKAPSRLEIPPQTAWWTVDRAGGAPVRRKGNVLLIEDDGAPVETTARNTLNVRVFRKWTDAQVPQQEVRLQFNVGGAPREVVLGPVVDAARWQPVGVQSAWPVQWQSDGKLRVQLQPGSNDLSLTLRCTQQCQGPFPRPVAAAPWPQVEYWALQSDPAFRVVSWNGQAVDPRQVGAPAEWTQLPWVAVAAKGAAGWTVKSRGPADKDAPLVLDRQAWLDFDGQDWWVLDTVSGPAPRSGRLEALAPYRMVAATQSGQPVLVSRHDDRTGVELRTPHLAAQVLLRQPDRAPTVPIGGVAGEFSTVQWRVHMPAGYQVLFAPGADEAHEVWWNRWRLTQVLSVALLLVLSWRWAGWRALLPAALLIALSYHTPGLPRWSWGLVLGLGLLAHSGLPEKLRKAFLAAWRVVLVLWVLLAAAFAINQVRAAMYPDWVIDGQGRSFSYYGPGMQQAADAGAVYEEAAPAADHMEAASNARMEKQMTAPAAAPMPMPVVPPPAPPPVQQIDESGVKISAGPGLPSWSSHRPVRLSWQGPITEQDTVRLWIVGPFLVGLGRWLSVALLLLVGWSLWKRSAPPPRHFYLPRRSALALLMGLCLPMASHAAPVSPAPVEPPPASWMDRLGQEKHPIPECAPNCVSIASARLSGQAGELVVELEAHAQARAALPLPVDAEQALLLRQVHHQGQAMPAVLMEGEQPMVQLPRGVSTLRLVFTPRAAAGTLHFPQRPGRIEASGSGWGFSGIDRARLSSGVLGWQRMSATPARGEPREKGNVVSVVPFVQVHRTLVLGPKWEVHTQVLRVAPETGAFVVKVPLLEGEQPRQDLPRDDKGSLVVSFQAGQGVVEWTADLPAKTRLTLTAPNADSAVERWTINASQRFHVQASGMASRADAPLVFQPLPGEKLVLEIAEPAPVEGGVAAVDNASVSQQWGPRGQSINLDLSTRATTTTDLMLGVPEGLDLVQVMRNGAPLAGARVESGKLLLPVLPGEQAWSLSFRTTTAPSLKVGTPAFTINAPVANLTQSHTPGAKRWVLGTPGPGKAPAVAYWPWLVVLLVAAWLVGQWRHSPLKTWQWVLLGLGFSVAAPWKVALVGGWLVALNQRQRHSDRLHASPAFNLVQALLVILTLFAVATIVGALPQSLLASPDMKIYGATDGTYSWFVDQVEAGKPWPQAFVISAPMWLYRLLMLAWSLWLAISALNWLRDGLRAWLLGGHWHAAKRTPPPTPTETPPPAP